VIDLVPTKAEKLLIARCLMESGLLIGDNADQIWTHPRAYRALATWRLCIDAIVELIGGRHGVQASFVKACVLQADGLDGVPFALEEVADFLVTDDLARLYWDALIGDTHYPHRCPHCQSAAFVGFLQVDCKARCPASVPRG
jgi:hypothetical protein